MSAPLLYPQAVLDPWSNTERCRAERSTTRNGTFARCANRTADGSGLCWRHR